MGAEMQSLIEQRRSGLATIAVAVTTPLFCHAPPRPSAQSPARTSNLSISALKSLPLNLFEGSQQGVLCTFFEYIIFDTYLFCHQVDTG
jgi:hypothetical protein